METFVLNPPKMSAKNDDDLIEEGGDEVVETPEEIGLPGEDSGSSVGSNDYQGDDIEPEEY